jgi:hypothetical protein
MKISIQGLLKNCSRCLVSGALAICVCQVQAGSIWGVASGLHVLGEIVVPDGSSSRSQNSRSTSPTAAETRSHARAALLNAEASAESSPTIQVIQDEESYMTPGTSSAPPDNRRKAREYSQDNPTQILVTPKWGTENPSATGGNKENASRNLNKARRYSQDQDDGPTNTGKFVQIGTSMGVVGKDGVIEIVCDGVNNNAGRIGDDSKSGSMFTIMVAGKPAIARCK